MKTTTRKAVVFWTAALSAVVATAQTAVQPDIAQDVFEELCAKVQQQSDTASEAEVIRVFDTAKELGRVKTASLVVKNYMAQQQKPSAALLTKAIDNAILAGDWRTAVARCKTFLKSAPPGKQASDIAAAMYSVQIDCILASDDAYRYMGEQGRKFRQSDAAKKFDVWYVNEAQRRSDYAALAGHLAVIFRESMPLEKERLHFWPPLDWLIEQMALANSSAKFDAVPNLRQLVPAIRGDARRQARLAFYTANLAFKAGVAGKDQALLDKEYQLVVTAATQYVQKFPDAGTMSDVMHTFAEGDPNSGWAEANQREAKRAFYVQAFSMLPAAEQTATLANVWKPWNSGIYNYLATPDQWRELGVKHPAVFQSSTNTVQISFPEKVENPTLYTQMTSFLRGVRSENAVVINSLAAGPDLNTGVDHLMKSESYWLHSLSRVPVVLTRMWDAYEVLPRDELQKLPDNYYGKMMVRYGSQYVARTPLALDTATAGAYMLEAWRHSGSAPEDRSQFASHLDSLAWVPYDEAERKAVYSGAYGEFKTWAGNLRTRRADAATAGKQDEVTKLDAEIARISVLEAAFKAAMDRAAPDLTKAPDALCGQIARAVVARRAKDAAQFVAAARAVYPLVKGYEARKMPLGRSIMRLILAPGADVDVSDFQCEVLTDQFSRYNPAAKNPEVDAVADIVMTSRPGWRWGYTPAADRAMVVKINTVIEKAFTAQLDKGQVPEDMLSMLLGTRSGAGWSDSSLNQDLFVRLYKEKRLPQGRLMFLDYSYVNFPEEYVIGEMYDDLFAADIRAAKLLGPEYRAYGGTDKEKKVRNAAAEVIASYPTLPFGYGDTKPEYDRGQFFGWQSYAFGAESSAVDAMRKAVEARYGATRFDTYAMGSSYFYYTTPVVTHPEGRKEFFTRLDQYLAKLAKYPDRGALPYLQNSLPNIKKAETLTDEELSILMKMFSPDVAPAGWNSGHGHEHAATLVYRALIEREREQELFALIPYFWRLARSTGDTRFIQELTELSEELMQAGAYDLAVVCSKTGMDLLGNRLGGDIRTSLNVVYSRAVSNIGGVIPVRREDPRYPLFASQADFFSGNYQRAWQHLAQGREILLDNFRELDPGFCTWLINRSVEFEDLETAENLARVMIQWMESDTVRFSPEVRVEVLLAYANIAFARPDYPRARALYERIVAVSEFGDLRGKIDAELRIAEVDRLSGEPAEAIKRLEKILENKDHYVQTEGFFHMAKVRTDMEEFLEAKEDLARVFALDTSHVEGRILEGRINLAIKHLEESTDIPLGFTTKQRFIVPGKLLKVSVEDRTLSFVGRTSVIEIRAWTESGDEEFFTLTPFADSRTRFRGEIGTELAPPAKRDRMLQVLGKDKIFYDFSESFKKTHNVTSHPGHYLTVISESELYASSGAILSKEEIQQIALENMIRAKLGASAGKAEAGPMSQYRPGSQVKPGNRINIRVIDPDRSVTADKDTLLVRATVTSGDVIEGFRLEESETHSGVFNGSVPTEPAPAVAFATDSDEGTEPNFVISAGEYPAWVALPDNKRPKSFSVDLNDSVFFGKMNVESSVPGRKLKDFLVQVSSNGKDFRTVGSWPEEHEPWDGSPRGIVTRYSGGAQIVSAASLKDLDARFEDVHPRERRFIPIKTLKVGWDEYVFGHADALGIHWDQANKDTWYVARFSAAVYVPKRQVRNFKLVPKTIAEGIQYYMTVDGEFGSFRDEDKGVIVGSETEFNAPLNKGVHRINVYVVAFRRTKPAFEVLCDTEEPPYMEVCPAEMFDIVNHPQIRREVYEAPARVVQAADENSFDITFNEGTRARAFRFLMHDFETDAPALNGIRLALAGGDQLLPTAIDLMELKKNEILEIIPGDRISITYEDPRYIDKNNRVREATLSATYANARIEPNMVVGFSRSPSGAATPILAQMRRFKPGDSVDIFITDPDMDVSGEPDKITFTVQTTESEPAELEAIETDKHTGRFLCRIFPVEEEPQRKTDIKITEGDEIIMRYMDQENTDPGIPWPRSASLEQIWYQTPEIRAYETASEPLAESELAEEVLTVTTINEEIVPARRRILARRPSSAEPPEEPGTLVLGGPLLIELLWPTIAQSTASGAELFVQTSSGRISYGRPIEEGFDIRVPGTLRLRSHLGSAGGYGSAPLGYKDVRVFGPKFAGDALEDGRFSWSVPMRMAPVQQKSLAVIDPDDLGADKEPMVLNIKGSDTIYIGFCYTNDLGETKWITRDFTLDGDAFLDVMDRQFQETAMGRYVGESVYFRVIDRMKDASDGRDRITIGVKAESGGEKDFELTETMSHSGIFKGLAKMVYAREKPEGAEEDIGPVSEMPVKFGDAVNVAYVPAEGKESLGHSVEIFKGADGDVIPFTKTFKDPEIAIKTQLSVAEAYFELAKKHRALGRKDITKQEIAMGKKILQEALRDYPDTEARAQGDYLLANLALEFAEESKEEMEKKTYLDEALSRFTEIVGTYRDSMYAPKAQYKKALTLEKMGEIDAASEEYVKLSYRWPENELIAETIARLGQYFFMKGKQLTDAEGLTDPVEIEKSKLQAKEMFTTAAEVFARLAVRFPSHKLAEKTTVLSSQCYMRAEKYDKAVKGFLVVVDKKDADKDVRAEAMYWCGDSYMKLKGEPEALVNAYRMFKRLTWDYPASKWAKFARGRLVDETLASAGSEE